MGTELTLTVTGMTCGGCEKAVMRAVGALPGVAAVTASHALAQVRVAFDADLVTAEAIAAKIGALGYRVDSPRVG